MFTLKRKKKDTLKVVYSRNPDSLEEFLRHLALHLYELPCVHGEDGDLWAIVTLQDQIAAQRGDELRLVQIGAAFPLFNEVLCDGVYTF